MIHNRIIQALGVASIMTASGCGGDNGSAPHQSSYSVTAIDGYLRNAEIWLDMNGNFTKDNGEPSAFTGERGRAELDVTGIDTPEQYSVVARAIAGKTVDEDSVDGEPVTT